MQETLIVTGVTFNDEMSGATLIVRCSPPPVTMTGIATPITQPVTHAFKFENATVAHIATYAKGTIVTGTLTLAPAATTTTASS